MSLNLKFKVGILVHKFNNAVDFAHRFGFDGRFANVESDAVGDNFAVGRHTVVKRHCALGNTDVLDEEYGVVLITANPKVSRLGGVGNVNNPALVEIHLVGAFVERNCHVMPSTNCHTIETCIAATGFITIWHRPIVTEICIV